MTVSITRIIKTPLYIPVSVSIRKGKIEAYLGNKLWKDTVYSLHTDSSTTSRISEIALVIEPMALEKWNVNATQARLDYNNIVQGLKASSLIFKRPVDPTDSVYPVSLENRLIAISAKARPEVAEHVLILAQEPVPHLNCGNVDILMLRSDQLDATLYTPDIVLNGTVDSDITVRATIRIVLEEATSLGAIPDSGRVSSIHPNQTSMPSGSYTMSNDNNDVQASITFTGGGGGNVEPKPSKITEIECRFKASDEFSAESYVQIPTSPRVVTEVKNATLYVDSLSRGEVKGLTPFVERINSYFNSLAATVLSCICYEHAPFRCATMAGTDIPVITSTEEVASPIFSTLEVGSAPVKAGSKPIVTNPLGKINLSTPAIRTDLTGSLFSWITLVNTICHTSK